MKGLLIKDFKLMKMQKNFFIFIVLIALAMSAINQNMAFVVGYMTMIIPMFASSTVSYDEFDNGYAFLFTLPISRRIYVLEKYFFAALLALMSLMLSAVLCIGAWFFGLQFALTEALITASCVFAAALIFQSILIPVQLKFGAERSRIALICIIGAIFVIGFFGTRLLESLGIDLLASIEKWQVMGVGILFSSLLAVTLAMLTVSYQISCAIVEKKEF